VLFACALLAALPDDRQFRALLLEAGEVPDNALERLCTFLGDSRYDLVVIASWHKAFSDPKGWVTISMDSPPYEARKEDTNEDLETR